MYINLKSIQRAIAPILLSTFLLLTACGSSTPPSTDSGSNPSSTTPTETIQTTPQESATTGETSTMADISGLPPQKGSAFNQFLPDAKGTDYERTFTQEKEGFAEIKLTLKGTEMAKISISDTVTNLSARNKFAGVTELVNGFPFVVEGKNSSAVLVGDRYQVKVMSRDPAFTAADRKEWLAEVDLKGLAKLK